MTQDTEQTAQRIKEQSGSQYEKVYYEHPEPSTVYKWRKGWTSIQQFGDAAVIVIANNDETTRIPLDRVHYAESTPKADIDKE